MFNFNKNDNFKVVVGDLFDTEDSVIGHGTNTKGKMGSGIAVLFKRKFPIMHEDYVELCSEKGEELFGRTQLVELDESEALDNVKFVANVFSQDKTGKDASYSAFIFALEDLFLQLDLRNASGMLKDRNYIPITSVSIPRIGCGIGGLDWDVVQELLEDYMNRMQPRFTLTVVVHPSDI